MKEKLEAKKKEIEEAIVDLEKQSTKLQEQLLMYRGAWQYNNMLIQECETETQQPAVNE